MSDAVDEALAAYANIRRLRPQCLMLDDRLSAPAADSASSASPPIALFGHTLDPSVLARHFFAFLDSLTASTEDLDTVAAAIAMVLSQQLHPSDAKDTTLLDRLSDSQRRALDKISANGKTVSISASCWGELERILSDSKSELWPVVRRVIRVRQEEVPPVTAGSTRSNCHSCRYYKINASPGSLISCALSADGCYLAAGMEDSSVRVWRIMADAPPLDGSNRGNLVMSMPGGKPPPSSTNDRFHDPNPSSTDRSPDCAALRGHSGPVYDLTFLATSETSHSSLLLSCSYDHTVRLFDLDRGGTNVAVYQGHNSPVWKLAESPGHQRFATGSLDRRARYFDVERRYPLRVLAAHDDSVDAVKFHPNGELLATGSADGTVRLWSLDSATPVRLFTGLSTSCPPDVLTFSSDGSRVLCVAEDGRLYVWDVGDGRLLDEPKQLHNDRCLSIVSEGRWIASAAADGVVRIDAEEGPFTTPDRSRYRHKLGSKVIITRAQVTSA
uniref:Uncharacterized protein n=1 Tax=Plectus sambesii TaxID=2011161 RepID=A0A914WGG9_9BILA